MKTDTIKSFLAMGLLMLGLGGMASAHTVPTVDGRFYGGGDGTLYTHYYSSIYGSKLWYTFADNTLYVALVVSRDVNDNVFGNPTYTENAGWNPPHPAERLVDSEYVQFTLTVGDTTFQWNQGYGELVDGVWKSDHTTGAGSGTPPPGYVSSSSFVWNINNYVANPSPNWNLYANGDEMRDWKSPFEPSAPNTVLGLEGYPATGPITWSDHYQWEWPMVYEWSVDLSSFGPEPVFVISKESHHSPSKNGDENDYFEPPPGGGFLTDYGDLPAPYPTLLVDDGARHYVVPNGALLGALVDPEPDGQPHPQALGDDLSGLDDEDGVALLTPLIPGQNARFEVVIGFPGYLSAFVDWNNDGTLDPVTLVSATGPAPVAAGILGDRHFSAVGTYEITVAVPEGAQGPMASRWRITNLPEQGGNSPTGLATTGEVEDHIFIYTATIGDRVWLDENKNGIQDPGEPGFPDVKMSLYRIDVEGENVTTNYVVSVRTNAQGLYGFATFAGTYVLRADIPAGYAFSPAFVGSDPEIDSNFGPHHLWSDAVTVADGETRLDLDAGLYYSPTLAMISNFRAFERDGGVVVEWTVIEQFGTLGYELQRRVGESWTSVGFVDADLSPYGPYVYELADDPDLAPSGTHTWRIREYEVTGGANTYDPYTVEIGGAAADYAAWAAGIDWQGADDSPDADPDGDGLTNWQEFLAGTDPLNPNSVLRINAIGPAPEDSGIEVRWANVPGRIYVVAYAPTLVQPFLPLSGPVAAVDTESRFVLPGVDTGFFRVILKCDPHPWRPARRRTVLPGRPDRHRPTQPRPPGGELLAIHSTVCYTLALL